MRYLARVVFARQFTFVRSPTGLNVGPSSAVTRQRNVVHGNDHVGPGGENYEYLSYPRTMGSARSDIRTVLHVANAECCCLNCLQRHICRCLTGYDSNHTIWMQCSAAVQFYRVPAVAVTTPIPQAWTTDCCCIITPVVPSARRGVSRRFFFLGERLAVPSGRAKRPENAGQLGSGRCQIDCFRESATG